MDKKELEQVRYMCEMNFRYSLYKDVKFPYMHSIGIKDIFQSFANEEKNVGVIHLSYRKGENGKMYWHSSWLDRPEQAIELAMEIHKEHPCDDQKLMQGVRDFIQSKYEPSVKNILLN